MGGGASRGGRGTGGPNLPGVRAKMIRGRSEVAVPDRSGFIVGGEGKGGNNRLCFATCLDREFLGSMGTESKDLGGRCVCDRANSDGDGDIIKDKRLPRWPFMVVVARPGVIYCFA